MPGLSQFILGGSEPGGRPHGAEGGPSTSLPSRFSGLNFPSCHHTGFLLWLKVTFSITPFSWPLPPPLIQGTEDRSDTIQTQTFGSLHTGLRFCSFALFGGTACEVRHRDGFYMDHRTAPAQLMGGSVQVSWFLTRLTQQDSGSCCGG